MSERTLDLPGRQVRLLEEGRGEPLLYLHGFPDVHGAVAGWQPFHQRLQERFRLLAPAHPGCAGSEGMNDMDSIDDVTFHYIELLDALGLQQVNVAGTDIGGWIAAELAVHHPERIRRLALVAATGLHVPGASIGDVFMLSRPRDGGDMSDFRRLLFAAEDARAARDLFPNGRASVEDEVLRYRTLTFAGRIGWRPPYLYDPKLRERLRRVRCPVLAVWGADDHMVPVVHAHAYAESVPHGQLRILNGAGHCVHLEQPDAAAEAVGEFVAG